MLLYFKKDDLKEVQEGDPKYLAPEVLEGSNNITTAVDIFSLGMSILELATDLDLPRGGEPWHKLRNGQIPHDLTASLSPQLVQIIHAMIDSNHKRRASADVLLADVHDKRRMAMQKKPPKHEFLGKIGEKLKVVMGFFFTLVRRDLIGPLVFGCRYFISGGVGLMSWLMSRQREQLASAVSTRWWMRSSRRSRSDLNNTSTPNKTDPDVQVNTNLLDNEDQDEDCEWEKYQTHLKNVQKYDRHDCKSIFFLL